MLLRVEDDLHARLTERAQRSGRSLNSLATDILEQNVADESSDARATLRAKARKLGLLARHPASPVSASARERALSSMRGTGPILDRLFTDGR